METFTHCWGMLYHQEQTIWLKPLTSTTKGSCRSWYTL